MINRITLLLFIGLALGQSYVDPLTAARLAKSAAEKAQAEADAATEAAIQAAAEKAAAQARSNAKQAMEDEKARKLAETKAAEEAELDAIAKAAGDEARRKIAEELGLDYEKGIMLKTAVIYLRNGERIDGDIVEIVAADKYIVVRTERENRKRIRNRDINYVLHNTNGLTDYLQAAGKEPEPKPELIITQKRYIKNNAEQDRVSSGYSLGFSLGVFQHGYSNSFLIGTPYGFKIAMDWNINLSAVISNYAVETTGGGSISNNAIGFGGNWTFAKLLFCEVHYFGGSMRYHTSMSLERLMKKPLNMPVNVLVGIVGFISNNDSQASHIFGLNIRFDYTL